MIGAIAGFLTTAAFLPQVIKVIKTKDVSGISLLMYLLQVCGISLWAIHGLIIHDMAIFIANTITVTLELIILYYKITCKEKAVE